MMHDKFASIDEILDFAINSEQEAIDFYSDLVLKAKNNAVKQIFMEFVKEEMNHKAKLLKIKEEKVFVVSAEKIQDLKISDYLAPVNADQVMSYSEALVMVMKKAAYKLYSHLASIAPNHEIKVLFTMLANEEATHKLHFEKEYDEFVLREN
jgi:rubrerythrin